MLDRPKARISPAVLKSVLLLAALNAASVLAETGVKPEFELAAGVGWDSSLVVEELDVSAETADESLNLEAHIALAKEWDNGLATDFSFGVADNNYRNVDQFDLNTQLWLASLAYDLKAVSLNLSCYQSSSRLGGRDYLSLTNCAPTASYFVNDQLYLQGGIARMDKNFSEGSERDALNVKTFGSAWYFFDATRHYMTFTVAHKSEDARTREYDYSSNEVSVNWIKVTELFAREARLKFGAKIENRSYKSSANTGPPDTDSVNASSRSDHRKELFGEARVTITERTWLEFSYRFLQNDSTLEEVEYDQNSMELRTGFNF